MSRVDLIIGGHNYAVACPAGEEDHVRMLGGIIEEKMAALPGATNQSEVRGMLFSALMLADEVFELRQQAGQPSPSAASMLADPALAERLNGMAARLEQLAIAIEDLF